MLPNWGIQLAFGLLLIAALLYSFDPSAVLSTVMSAKPQYLALAAAVYSITFLILSTRWRLILKDMGEELPLLSAYQAFAGGMILSDLTPGRLGELSRPFLVRDRIDLKRGVASIALDRYADLITIFVLSTSGMLLLAWHSPYLQLASLMVLLIVISSAILWHRRTAVIDRLDRLGSPRICRIAHSLDGALCDVTDLRVLLVRSVLFTAMAWITHAVRVHIIASSIGYDLHVQKLFLLLPIVSSLSLVPVSISGLGLVEGGLAALLAGLGVPVTAGLSIALLDRAITVAFHILAGGKAACKAL